MERKKTKQGFSLRAYWDKFLNLFGNPDDVSEVGQQEIYSSINAPVVGARTVEDSSGIFRATEQYEQSSDEELIRENDMYRIFSIVLEEKEENINTIVDVPVDCDKMLHECADLIREYDSYASRVENEDEVCVTLV